ncbi:uncharacterized protein LACBIDRAFT_316217 [Laccaria bicolor S238N-H82]|uniref:Predicted protein n=1 Tax=Laccaria bicolor (strain S238N-H82 / ATCC MYA-4686) TaxID=486041 RepID=B0E0G3_LACBS|nr:uncharacterized protein LACBIDRAFT_316217 [Laccaria bicolor S238N-H82]EDQ99682.1 predicted protein [Laccaria bicolor S238N-H82]|eukprot:XP_001889659.1 predicted protein [Laccaria bicolor S238N-H82]
MVCVGLVSSSLYPNEHPSGHTYNVYPQPNNPAIDLYMHMWNWKEFYETHLLGKKLKPDDYIFPSLGVNGLVAHPHIPVSSDIVQKRINEWAAAAGITGAGHFTQYFTVPHLFLQESSHSSGIPVESCVFLWNSCVFLWNSCVFLWNSCVFLWNSCVFMCIPGEFHRNETGYEKNKV